MYAKFCRYYYYQILCNSLINCQLKMCPYKVLYFLEFFQQVLLISECANMWVQFEGGVINIVTLTHLYAHCAPSRFSLNERKICT